MGMKVFQSFLYNPKVHFILDWGIRILLACVFISYGIGKLLGGQFGGLTQEELYTPIGELSLFKIGWYLFDHQPFKATIGVTQIVASILLIIPKTKYIGILFLMPIIGAILIIDLTIMPPVFQWGFGFRLSAYLLYLLYILLHNKILFQSILNPPQKPIPLQNKWHYLWLLLLIPLLEMVPSFFQGLIKLFFFLF
jgi:uncharacterized membrane protein YphA (DoxX/SURF4 family)